MSASVKLLKELCVEIEGSIDFANAVEINARVEDIISKALDAAWVVDLHPLQRGNSALLSLIMTWMRRVATRGGSVQVIGAPLALFELARACAMDEILPLQVRKT